MREMSKSATTDLELVNAIKEKKGRESEVAFNTLFKKYHDVLLFNFRGLIQDKKEDAEELVLEAFVKMNSNLEKFDSETAVFSTWLFKLTKNVFIDSSRKKKEESISLSDLATCDEENHFIEYEIESPDGNPEIKMITSERNKIIADIINKMPSKKLARVIKMRFFDGMSYEKISVATGNPLGTVKAFIFRAKQILEEEFVKANLAPPKKNKKA